MDPVWPVVELVAQLVEHLLQLEELHEPAHVLEGFEEAAVLHRRGIGGEKGAPRLGLPGVERVGLGGAPLRVAEGAQHSGHVAQRRVLAAAFGERPRRLALEVDDEEVVVRHQHLSEVVVAVVADLERGLGGRGARVN